MAHKRQWEKLMQHTSLSALIIHSFLQLTHTIPTYVTPHATIPRNFISLLPKHTHQPPSFSELMCVLQLNYSNFYSTLLSQTNYEVISTTSGPIYKSSTSQIVYTKEWRLMEVESLNWFYFFCLFHFCPSYLYYYDPLFHLLSLLIFQYSFSNAKGILRKF